MAFGKIFIPGAPTGPQPGQFVSTIVVRIDPNQYERDYRGTTWTFAGRPPNLPIPGPPLQGIYARVVQEYPLGHPTPFSSPGTPPVVAPPVFAAQWGNVIRTVQEQPWHNVPGGINFFPGPPPPPSPGAPGEFSYGYVICP